jgi:hypothetical protein
MANKVYYEAKCPFCKVMCKIWADGKQKVVCPHVQWRGTSPWQMEFTGRYQKVGKRMEEEVPDAPTD